MPIWPLLRKLTRLVVVWFALSLMAASASPLVNPKRIDVLCGEGGALKVVVIDEHGLVTPIGSHTLDCPNCLLAVPPPSLCLATVTLPAEFHYLLSRYRTAHIPSLSGASMPPRGPPAAT